VIGLDRYFPPAFGKVHPRFRTPYVAILVQAVLATVFLLISQLGKGSTVEHAYLVLLDTQLLVYFIPYLYLFLCLLRQARGQSQTGQLPADAWCDARRRLRLWASRVRDDRRRDSPGRRSEPRRVRREGDRRRGRIRGMGTAIYLRGRGSRRRVAA
jgi:hypothetical protein